MEKLRQWIEDAKKYLREVRGELRKVVWPDRRQTTVLTSVVILSSALVAVIIWAFDKLVSGLMLLLLGR
ncbi:preprotein translocase subunit SecE [Caldinitratiruptor microaerophilus]|uniref:Protein translocase subunit SecE n=1 Tax=Caldinitratiruptor microaerophilus TaxID=671077 RepID=A0AA35CP48_9FIRM|nr:preprotein translocase subunit SecE [Caldinitratiruptor microaerophilus]BDG62158.1 hypothetical protein caldi_32480 [Caldinitratiruptor microaerophilus]